MRKRKDGRMSRLASGGAWRRGSQLAVLHNSLFSLNFIVELSEVNFISKLLKIAHYVLRYNLH